MTKNKKKLRRVERRYSVTKSAQTLVLAGILLAGGVSGAMAAEDAWKAGNNWGDLTLNADAATAANDGLWRDGHLLPGTPNWGNLDIADKSFTVGNNTVVGNGNVSVGDGGSLIINTASTMQISQGSLTLKDGATLTMTNGTLDVDNDITAEGALTSTLSSGTLRADNIYWGSNAFVTSGTFVVDVDNVTAKNLTLNSSGAFRADSVTAKDAASTIIAGANNVVLGIADFGTKALTVTSAAAGNTTTAENLTVGALKVGNAGSTTGKLTVTGNLNAAAAVTIDGDGATNTVLTLGANPIDTTLSVTGDHTTAGVTITKGKLELVGRAEELDADGEVTTGAVGQKLTGDIILNAGSATDAVVNTSAGTHTVKGDIVVNASKFGTVTAASNLNVNNIKLNGTSGSVATLVLNGAGTVKTDALNMTYGAATLTNGTLQTGHDKVTLDANSTLTVTSGTLQLTGGDYNHVMGAQTAGLVMNGGTLRVDGQLTLTANTAGNTQAINTGSASAVDTVKGSIIAQTLKTDSTNTNGVTITAGSVQILGNGTDPMYTTAVSTNAHSITVTDGNGSLVLGATANANLGKDANYGGAINTVVLSAAASKLQFGHGDITVSTLAANTNGALTFKDDTGFGGTNALTLGTAGAAFDVKNITLSEGDFAVNGDNGVKLDSAGTAKIDVVGATKSGKLNVLNLGGGTGALTTEATNTGTYTIGTLQLGHANNVVTVSAGKVITNDLSLGSAASTGKLTVSGGTWQIDNITKGTGSADFTLSNAGTLLIGKSFTLGNNSNDSQFSIGSDDFVVKSAATSTLGSTGTITIADGPFTMGTTNSSANSTKQNLAAQKILFATTGNTITVGNDAGSTLSLTGDDTTAANSLTNATSIQLGNNGNTGTLNLGAATGTAGGKYTGTIKVGSATASNDDGILSFNGGDFELTKLHLNTGANGTAVVNLASGKGKLTITTTDASGNNGSAGLVLAGNSAATDHVLNVGTGNVAGVTEYEIVGGVTVTKGTVNFGNVNKASNINILKNAITLNGSAVGNAIIEIDGGHNTVNGITALNATTATGTVDIKAGSLTVKSDLDLSKALLKLGDSTADGSTLAVEGNLTIGTLAYNAGIAAGTTNVSNTSGEHISIQADKLAVKDATGNASSIAVAAGSNATELNLAIGTGGITASAFKMDNTTVNLLGAGGKINLTDTAVDGGAMVVGGGTNTTTLNVGSADTPAVKSDWSTDKMSINKATVNVANGSLAIKTLSTTANGSAITVGDFGPEPEDDTTGALRVETATFAAGNNNLIVDLGYAQFGSVDAALGAKVEKAMQATNSLSALAVTGKQLNLSNVTATIGNARQGDQNIGNAVRPLNDKSVEFGDDSLTYIDYNTVGKTEAAIKTGGNVFVDTGAKLYLAKDGGLRAGDTIKILTTTATDGVKGMWEAANVGTTSRLINLSLTVDEDHKNVTGHTSLADPAKTMPGISSSMAGLIRDMANQVGVDVDSKNAGIKFVSRAADRTFLTNDNQAASTIEGAAQLAVVGAAPAMTLSAVQAGTSTVTTRTSFASPLMDSSKAVALHKDTDGTLSVDSGLNAGNGMKNGFGLWIMPLYQSNSAWGMKADGFKGGYKSDLGGVALGADYTFNDMFRLGLAFNIGGGYAESNGDFNKTENSFNFWGINAYGGWTMNNFGITADVGYTGNYNKLQQELPSGMGMSDIKSDVNSSAWTAGLRGEYKFATEALDIIPHVGVRYTGLTTDEYKAKSGGDTVFKVDQSFQSIWTFPIGVTLAKEIETGSGWIIRPQVDLGITPATGDVKAKSKVRIPGVDSQAEMKMQVVDYMSYDGGVGLEMKKDNVSFGINYNIQASEHRTGHGVFGTFRYEF